MRKTTMMIVLCIVGLFTGGALTAMPFVIDSEDATLLSIAVEQMVDDIGRDLSAFDFDMYRLTETNDLQSRVTTMDACEIFELLDLHVDLDEVRSVEFFSLYTRLVDLVHETSPTSAACYTNLRTLKYLFIDSKGSEDSWSIFQVRLTKDQLSGPVDVDEYLAIHRKSGTLYAIEIGD